MSESVEDSAKADRQAAMSKALGAAFLKHQVDALERSVDGITFSRQNPAPPARQRLYDPSRPQQNPQPSTRGSRGRGARGNRAAATQRQLPKVTAPLPKRIVDVSALVHALPVLKQWVRDGDCQIVVPLEAISTLDMLKKVPPPLNHLAREATRWLDQQFERNAPQIAAAAASTSSSSTDSRSHAFRELRLTAQPESASLSWEEAAANFISPLPTSEAEEGEVIRASDTPRFFQSILQCALYYATKYDPAKHGSTAPLFVIALPSDDSLQASQSLPNTTLSNSKSPQPPHGALPNESTQTKTRPTFNAAERADGVLAHQWAQLFGLKISVIDPAMVADAKEKFKEWQRQQQQQQSQASTQSTGQQPGPQIKSVARPAGANSAPPAVLAKTLFVP